METDYELFGARPRRDIPVPARYVYHDVDHPGYHRGRYRGEVETTRQEGTARMTSLTYSPTPGHLLMLDAVSQETTLGYGAESQDYSQETQLAHQRA